MNNKVSVEGMSSGNDIMCQLLRQQLDVLTQILEKMPGQSRKTLNDKVMMAILLLPEVGPNMLEISRRVKANRTTMIRSAKWAKFREFFAEFQNKEPEVQSIPDSDD